MDFRLQETRQRDFEGIGEERKGQKLSRGGDFSLETSALIGSLLVHLMGCTAL